MVSSFGVSGNHLVYTCPYHPRLNAIEQFFNQMKYYLKLYKSKNYNELSLNLQKSIKNSPAVKKNIIKIIIKIVMKIKNQINSEKIKYIKPTFKIRTALNIIYYL